MTQVAESKDATSTQLPSVGHWIGGHQVAGRSGRRGPVFDPATGGQSKWVDFASVEEMDAAVAAAKAAFPAWRATSLSKRTEILFRIRNLVDTHRRDIAALLTAEHGKVPSDALGEVARGLENLEFACGVPHLLKGGFSEQVSSGVDVYQIRQPLGVVAGITPFNFPAMVPMWMFGNALACGNTFILKPSEKDPSASLFLGELLREAGVPEGVFNVVQGDKVAVDRILEHPDIAAVSFVGSTPIARYIYETGTRNGKRVQALGGAKNHMLVLPDADIDMAADAAVSAAYGSSGERCMAIATVVAVGDVADPLVEAIGARLPRIQVGPGTDPTAEMGPLVTGQHRDKVASYLDSAAEQGATVVADGREHPLYRGSDGFFLGVSLIDNVEPGMDAYRDEIFGPVLTVVRVGTYEEALQLINDNPYGNGTAIFTRDGGAARQFQFDVNVGMVGVNVPVPVPVAFYSFGGWKSSLFGDLHMYGPEGIQFYTRGKVITSRWPDPGTSSVDLGFPGPAEPRPGGVEAEEDPGEGGLERLRSGPAPFLLYALVALVSFPTLGLITGGRDALVFAHDLFDIPRSGVPGDWQQFGLTLWNTHVGAGNALLAQQAIGPFAIDVPLSMLIGPFPAFVVGCWLLAFVAGVSMHLFLRDSLGLVTPAVVFGAVVFALGFWHPIIGFPVPALPLLLWLLDRAVRPGRRRWAAVTGHVLLGVFVLYNGQAQIVVIIAAFELAWLTFVRRGWGRWPVMASSLVGLWALSFAIYGPVVMTQAVALPDSQRTIWEVARLSPLRAISEGIHRYSQVLVGVPVRGWGSSPSIYGTFFLGVVGVPLAIAALGALRRPRDPARVFVIACLVAIPVLDVLFEFLWPMQEQLGFLRSFQLVRVRHLFVMALAATAAVGLDQVLRRVAVRRRATAAGSDDPWADRWVPVAAVAFLAATGLIVAYGLLAHRHAVRALTVPGIGWLLAAATVAIGAAALVALWLGGRRPGWLRVAPAMVLVVAGGLLVGERVVYAYAEQFLDGELATWHQALDTTPAQAFVLAQPGSDVDRVLSFGEDANRMGSAGLLQADGYQTIYPLAYHTLFGALIRPQLDVDRSRARYYDRWGNRAIAFGPGVNAGIARLLGIRWLYVRQPPPPTFNRGLYPDLPWLPTVDGLVERFADGDATVYEVPDTVPRAFLAGSVSVEPDTQSVVDALGAASTGELRTRAWIEAGAAADALQSRLGSSSASIAPGTAAIETYTPDRVVIETAGDHAAVLVLTDPWSPGWTADVDGAPVDVARVDGALRGVPVGAGSHRVTFAYRPLFTYAGFGLAGIALVALVVVAFAVRSRDRRRLG